MTFSASFMGLPITDKGNYSVNKPKTFLTDKLVATTLSYGNTLKARIVENLYYILLLTLI